MDATEGHPSIVIFSLETILLIVPPTLDVAFVIWSGHAEEGSEMLRQPDRGDTH